MKINEREVFIETLEDAIQYALSRKFKHYDNDTVPLDIILEPRFAEEIVDIAMNIIEEKFMFDGLD